MFTALVLVCAGGIMDKDVCYFSVADVLYDNYVECKIAAEEASKGMEWWDENLGVTWEAVKTRCVSWTSEEV